MSLTVNTIFAVGGLILSSLAREFDTRPRQEIITECVCWSLIFICGNAYLHFTGKTSRTFNTSKLSTIAFGVTLLCLSCSVEQTTWSLAPLLGPASIIIERGLALLPEHEEPENKSNSPKSALPALLSANRRIIFLWLYAAVTMIGLLQNDSIDSVRLKLCWLFSQIVLYWGLFHRVSQPNNTNSENGAEALHTATELASYMIFITTPLAILWWQGVPSITQVCMVGIVKACRWMAVLVLAYESKLSVTIWITIFAVCTNAVWVYAQGWQTCLIVIGALVAIYRVATRFPQSTLGKFITLAFALCPVWAYGMKNGLGSKVTTWPSVGQATLWQGSRHPISHLAEEAKATFEKIQHRQSRSLPDAVREYRRRYGRPPPLGFDEWYNFAIENDVQWIDEYDYLTKSLEPFWQMPPKILREYIDQALSIDGAALNTLEIKDHNATLSQGSFQHRQLIELLQPVVKFLPDLKAALNECDEPRVLVPYDVLHSEASHHLRLPNVQAQPVYISDQPKQIIWNSVTLSCPPDSRARSALIEPRNDDLSPLFISNLSQSQDICLWPASASRKHGFLASPSTFKYTDRLAPIMATAKLSTFHDIMIPSSYYFQDDISQYDESKDLPWDQKKNVLYWRGSGTGGHWTRGSWRMGHRQRFVNFTNSAGAEIRLFKESTPGWWTEYKSTMSQAFDKLKVKFSNFIQCDDEDCKAQESYFKKAEWDANDDAHQYKILYNLDGNSFSGRYYRFLKSNSVVFMQALFKEWHDDRLIPWLHFVPISLGMEELPETTRYFLDDPEGKVIAARIASDSREWTRRVLRPIDLTAAYFRVFLEYSRLMDDDRKGYVG